MDDDKCIKCGNSSLTMCSTCSLYYCSVECQKTDWRDHMRVCKPMPKLVPVVQPLQENRSTEITIARNCVEQVGKSNTSKFLESKQLAEEQISLSDQTKAQICKEMGNACNENVKFLPSVIQKQLHSSDDIENNDPMDEIVLPPQPIIKEQKDHSDQIDHQISEDKGIGDKNNNSVNRDKRDSQNSTTTAVWMNHFEPPENIFFDVVVQFIEKTNPDIIWVSETKYMDKKEILLSDIYHGITKKCNINSINVGVLVAAPLDKIYYRAQVTKIDSELLKSTVRLIDYGDKLSVPIDELYTATNIMNKYPAYAFCVRFVKDISKLEVDAVASIQLMGPKSPQGYYEVILKPKNKDHSDKTDPKVTSEEKGISDKHESQSSTTTEVWMNHFKPPENVFFDVVVQFIEKDNPKIVWVTQTKYMGMKGKLLSEINHAKSEIIRIMDIRVGSLVIASVSKIYYRAQVVKVNNNLLKATVRLIDYGDTLSVPIDELFKAIPIMNKFPAYAFSVCIVQNINILQIDAAASIQLLGTRSPQGYYEVILKPKDDEPTLPDSPLAADVTPLKTSSSTEMKLSPFPIINSTSKEVYTSKDLKVVPIKLGESVPVVVVDPTTVEKGYVTAADFGNKDILLTTQQLLAKVNAYCKAAKSDVGYCPNELEICLAISKGDGCWYRAKNLKRFDNDIFLLVFVDYGNFANVSSKDIMPIRKDLMFPSIANKCWIEGIKKEQSGNLIDALNKNPIIKCKVMAGNQKNSYKIRIQNLDDVLA